MKRPRDCTSRGLRLPQSELEAPLGRAKRHPRDMPGKSRRDEETRGALDMPDAWRSLPPYTRAHTCTCTQHIHTAHTHTLSHIHFDSRKSPVWTGPLTRGALQLEVCGVARAAPAPVCNSLSLVRSWRPQSKASIPATPPQLLASFLFSTSRTCSAFSLGPWCCKVWTRRSSCGMSRADPQRRSCSSVRMWGVSLLSSFSLRASLRQQGQTAVSRCGSSELETFGIFFSKEHPIQRALDIASTQFDAAQAEDGVPIYYARGLSLCVRCVLEPSAHVGKCRESIRPSTRHHFGLGTRGLI